jgi:hypothetical protein
MSGTTETGLDHNQEEIAKTVAFPRYFKNIEYLRPQGCKPPN